MVSCREIYLSDAFDKDLDLVNLIIFDMNVSISEKLKNALKEAEITGINIVDNKKVRYV